MKTTTSVLFFLLLFVCGFTACTENEDSVPPILLSYEDPQLTFDNDTRTLAVTVSNGVLGPFVISGGVGDYTIQSSAPSIVQAEYVDGRLTLRLQEIVGTALVTIRDEEGREYVLTVQVGYQTETYNVASYIVMVQGDNMTVGDKKQLEEKIAGATTGPMAIESYQFVYDDAISGNGHLYMMGDETPFTFTTVTTTELEEIAWVPWLDDYQLPLKVFTEVSFTNGEHSDEFYLSNPFQPVSTKTIGQPSYLRCFIYDLTDDYREDYPAMEHVYLLQLVGRSHYGITGYN